MTENQTIVTSLSAAGLVLVSGLAYGASQYGSSIHDEKPPMLLSGVTISTSADDVAPIKQMQLEKFNGSNWKLFGELQSGSNS